MTFGPKESPTGTVGLESRRPGSPAKRLAPLRLGRRAGRPVVDALLQLSPGALVREPGELAARPRNSLGQQLDRVGDFPLWSPCVVAAEPGAVLSATEVERRAVEGRMRAGGRVHHRVRALLSQLRVRPLRRLTAAVLGVVGLIGARRDRLGDGARAEEQLQHLPVALMLVVEVVEVPVEPVLQRKTCDARLVRYPGVDDRLSALHHLPSVLLVHAPGMQRVAGEVEVVVRPETGKLRRRRSAPDLLLRARRTTRRPHHRDRRVPENDVDRRRHRRLPVRIAPSRLLAHEHDRRVLLGELQLRRGSRVRATPTADDGDQ